MLVLPLPYGLNSGFRVSGSRGLRCRKFHSKSLTSLINSELCMIVHIGYSFSLPFRFFFKCPLRYWKCDNFIFPRWWYVSEDKVVNIFQSIRSEVVAHKLFDMFGLEDVLYLFSSFLWCFRSLCLFTRADGIIPIPTITLIFAWFARIIRIIRIAWITWAAGATWFNWIARILLSRLFLQHHNRQFWEWKGSII